MVSERLSKAVSSFQDAAPHVSGYKSGGKDERGVAELEQLSNSHIGKEDVKRQEATALNTAPAVTLSTRSSAAEPIIWT